MAVVLHFQSTGTIPGDGRPVAMRGGAMTLGRGDENDLVLPDPDKTISKRHCAIEDQDGGIVVVDLSTNGTFLNYDKVPLGRVPTPLNDGDILTMGPYELLVEIAVAAAPVDLPPLGEDRVPVGRASAAAGIDDLLDGDGAGGVGADDFLDDLLGGAAPAGPGAVRRPDLGEDGLLPPMGQDEVADLLAPQPDEATGASRPAHDPAVHDHFTPPGATAAPAGGAAIPEDWDDLLGGDDPFAAPAPLPPDATPPPGPPALPNDPLPVATPAPAVPPPPGDAEAGIAASPVPAAAPLPPEPISPPATPGDDAAARAFLRSATGGEVDVPAAELTATMSRMGHVLRVMITGMREILMTRSSIKAEFRIEQTRISAGANNPLKFSVSPEQAIEAMIRPKARGYLDATDAARQAMSDIKAHEVAVMTGMEAALKGVLERLSPASLEGRMQAGGGLGGLLKGRKARYWEVYERMHAEISDQAENEFHELFAREFSRAYAEQLERLK